MLEELADGVEIVPADVVSDGDGAPVAHSLGAKGRLRVTCCFADGRFEPLVTKCL